MITQYVIQETVTNKYLDYDGAPDIGYWESGSPTPTSGFNLRLKRRVKFQ